MIMISSILQYLDDSYSSVFSDGSYKLYSSIKTIIHLWNLFVIRIAFWCVLSQEVFEFLAFNYLLNAIQLAKDAEVS